MGTNEISMLFWNNWTPQESLNLNHQAKKGNLSPKIAMFDKTIKRQGSIIYADSSIKEGICLKLLEKLAMHDTNLKLEYKCSTNI